MSLALLSLALLAPALRAYVPNAQKLPAPLLAGDQNLLFAAERGRLSGRKVEAVCAAYPRLAKLLAAESDEALRGSFAAAEAAWRNGAEPPPERRLGFWRKRPALGSAGGGGEAEVAAFGGLLAATLAGAGYVEVDAREGALCDALAEDAGLRVDVDDAALREVRVWRRGLESTEEPLSLVDTLEYLQSETVEKSWRRLSRVLGRSERRIEARFDPRNATSHRSRWRRRLVVGPLRRGARVSTRVGRRLLSRWGASTRSVDPDAEGCDVSDFAAGGCWPVAPAADEAYCAARPAGCVGVAQRGVGACVDSSLANATGPLDALRALARPPPRVAISYGDVVVLYATHGKAQKATRNGRPPRRLGLALYAGVPLRTLKTLIPTRRLRVRPLDAARFDLLTGATFLFLLAAQRLGTVWGDVLASVSGVVWVSRLIFTTKARRNMYELETTRALRDRVRAKGAVVCDALVKDAAAEAATLAGLCLGALRGLSWGEYDDVAEDALRERLLRLASAEHPDPATANATASAALGCLPDLEARGLAARTPAGRWRAAPGPESDARLDAAWARAFRRSRDDAAPPAGPSTVGEVISYPF